VLSSDFIDWYSEIMAMRPMIWEDNHLLLLDQTLLPASEVWLTIQTYQQVIEAILKMRVRGAPAIGIAAAYGLVLASSQKADLERAASELLATRPTAVNLQWAVQRLVDLPDRSYEQLLQEAKKIETEDLENNLRIGENGAALIPNNAQILTICNTGALATAGHGTALGIVRSAHSAGKKIHVWSCETRPRLQGLKITAFELLKEQIPFHCIADSAAASLMQAKKVDLVVVGADRISKNGDVANKIGTCSLAALASFHKIPFYVAAPESSFDLTWTEQNQIKIEERSSTELTHFENHPIAPEGTPVFNPAFDITPGSLVSAIITEAGIYRFPYKFQ